jgi:hypothetical protein
VGVIKNFLNSEKAVASGVLVAASSILAALGHMPIDDWQSYTLTCLGIYTGGKTLQGAAAKLAEAKKAPEQSAALRNRLVDNDAKADAALDAKFGDKE